MKTEMGEYVVGAYLKQCLECDFVDYNVRPPVGGLEGLTELDVIGLRFADRTAFLCEVATHLDGLHYGNAAKTLNRVKKKFDRARQYTEKHLGAFRRMRYMFWSPVVPRGVLTDELAKLKDVELMINGAYKACVEELRTQAKSTTRDLGNPFLRVLQILEHLRS